MKKIFIWSQFWWDSDGLFGVLFVKEVRGLGWMILWVVGELFDFDLDVVGVVFEGFVIVVGIFGEVIGKIVVR